LLHAKFSAVDYTLPFFLLYLNNPGLRKGPVKFFMGVLESPGGEVLWIFCQ